MSFEIRKYNANDKALWNNFLLTCKNSHFIFNRDFMDYHAEKFVDSSFVVTDKKDKIVALLPGNINDNIFYSHQGLTFGGFLLDKKIHAVDLLIIFGKLKHILKADGITKIIYKCIPTIYHKYPAQEDLYVLFRNDATLYRRDISSSIFIADGFKYSKGRKWGVNKAKKENVTCKELETPSEVWCLIREVLNEHHKAEPVHSEIEIDSLKASFPKNIRVYGAFLDDKIVSASVIFENDGVYHTQYLACNAKGRDVCALDMLIDYIINENSEQIKYFDFGISNEDNGNYLNEGLISQKESFGARAIVHDFYSVEII